eukprot:12388635-Alexandrium_andersonii.AAC.1
MSASLVGSEMCIRDRSRGGRSSCSSARAACARTWRSCRRQGCSPCAGAVSYTHLTLPTICSV